MNYFRLTLLAGVVFSTCAAARPDNVSPPANAGDIVQALEQTFGVHPGKRRNHTKGVCAQGSFVGMPAGQNYSRAALFSGAAIDVIARFSLGGGNPHAGDSAKGVRGMALEFKLPQGVMHMAMLNVPVFGASNPQTFYDMLVAMKPGPSGKRDAQKMLAFKKTHPDFQGLSAFVAANNPPVGYGNAPYYSLHAFYFVDTQGKRNLVRWHFTPNDGSQTLSDDLVKQGRKDFLERQLIERVKQGPVKWDMWITLGEPGDATNDPSKRWPKDRKEIKVGTVSISQAGPQSSGLCGPINYDPLVLTDGIEATDDPVLQMRSQAYAISYGKRLSGQ